MSNEDFEDDRDRLGSRIPRRIAAIAAGAVVLALGMAYLLFRGGVGDNGGRAQATFIAQRGDLDIALTESGSIDALEFQEIRSPIKGDVEILSIVEEGYLVTPQDIEDGLVLVQLDSAALEEHAIDREIDYRNAQVLHSEKRTQRDIQEIHYQGKIGEAEITARFALLDFEKFLGSGLADSIIGELKLDQRTGEVDGMEALAGDVDFASYADADTLKDGVAKQRLRQLEDELLIVRETYRLAGQQLSDYERKAEAGRITQDMVDVKRSAVQRLQSREKLAETNLQLYIEHTFQMEAQRLLSEYEMSLINLRRLKRDATVEMTHANFAVRSAEAQSKLQADRLRELREQIEMCIIRAERPGFVIYGSSTDTKGWRGGNDEAISAGKTIRHLERIIVVPDLRQMGLRVDIRESSLPSVAEKQTVTMRIDAFPDRILTGVVERVAARVDSEKMLMNPDLKVYPVIVRIDGVHGWLRPGMSADVVIHFEKLEDVVYIPLQSVLYVDAAQVCYVIKDGKSERREITTGSFTDDVIEVRVGLEQGEEVILLPKNTLTTTT